MDPIYVTEEKKQELLEELEHRKSVLRAEIGTKVREARELGDLKENAEYHAARDDQAKNETRIEEIEETLKRVKIFKRTGAGVIELSAKVTLRKNGSDEITYTLVGPSESDIREYKLSIQSPLGQLLVGKKVGDKIEQKTPSGATSYEILNVQ